MFITLVNWDKCSGCEKCVGVCPVDCFEMSEGKSLATGASTCIDCGACEEVCPEGAIVRSIGWGGMGPVRRSRIAA